MPFAAAIPFLGKAFSLAKGLAGLKGAAGAASAVKGVAGHGAAKAAIGGMRFAGPKLAGLGQKIGSNFAKAYPKDIPGRGIMGSLAPDLAFGTMAGIMTPGDLGDKVLAGTTDAVMGAGLTGGLRGLAGARPGSGLGNAIEWGGGMASGFASMPVSDALLRLKGGGQSPYDKLQSEQYAGIRREIEEDLLKQIMAGSRAPMISPMVGDPFMSNNGLGL